MTLNEAITFCEEVADYDAYTEEQRDFAEAHKEIAAMLRAQAEKNEIKSHSEQDVLCGCISLMEALVEDFEEWYLFLHGENAIENLEEDERYVYSLSYFETVRELFLRHTNHSGGTSTLYKCLELGISPQERVKFAFDVERE